MLDQGRLLELRDKTNRISIISSVLLLVNNIAGAAIQGVSSFKKNIKDHLNVILESVHSNKSVNVFNSLKNFIIFKIKINIKIKLNKIKIHYSLQRFGNCDPKCFGASEGWFKINPRGYWCASNATGNWNNSWRSNSGSCESRSQNQIPRQ